MTRDLDWFDPCILAPHFSTAVVNGLAETEADFLRTQLERHLFRQYDLAGADMYDRHGYFLVLRRTLELPEKTASEPDALAERLTEALSARPARRVAIVANHIETLLQADFGLFLLFMRSVEHAAAELRALPHPIQLQAFLLGAAPAFAVVEPAARRRAEDHAGLKVMPTDVPTAAWSSPHSFDIGPRHHFAVPHPAWYFLACGHRSTDPAEGWSCYEHDGTLTFVRADTGYPCLEGVFARTKEAMRLVGIRYEADPARFVIPAHSEDPFTLFHGLCQQLAVWQTRKPTPA